MNPVFASFLLLTSIGVIALWVPRIPAKRFMLVLGVLGLFCFSWMPIAWLVSQALEGWFHKVSQPLPEANAIVVLAGDVYASKPDRPFPLASQETFERCQFAAWLYKNGLHVPILAAGGVLLNEPASLTMRELLISEGVPPADIWIETRSRSTHENAVFGCDILRQSHISKIALVTEARFMLRAAACFRREGMNVIPMPLEFTRFPWELNRLLPGAEAIELNNSSLHEFGGLLWYRLHGWI